MTSKQGYKIVGLQFRCRDESGGSMLRRLKNQRGWVLIDCLTAAVIVAVALTALAGAYRQTVIASASATNYTRAVYLAQQALEVRKQYERQGPDNIYNNMSPYWVQLDDQRYYVQLIRVSPAEPITNILPIQARVSWQVPGVGVGNPQVDVIAYYDISAPSP